MSATKTVQQDYAQAFSGNDAENYERYFVPAIGAPFAADLVKEAALRESERVLDVACGTGIVTRLIADVITSGTVAGLDITPGMLDVARSITQASGRLIRWYESSAEAMPFPDASFDVVTCQFGLQFVPDQAAAVREMRRVLAAGGRALVSLPKANPFFDIMDAALARHIGPEIAAFVRKVFSLGDPAAAERLFVGAGFRDVGARVVGKTIHLPPASDFLWQYIHSTPMAGVVTKAPRKQIAALEREVAVGWQPWARDDGMICEQQIVVVTART